MCRNFIGYAISHDGRHWEKPELGLVDLDQILLTEDGEVDQRKAAVTSTPFQTKRLVDYAEFLVLAAGVAVWIWAF